MSDIRLAFVGLGWWGNRLAEAAAEADGVSVSRCFARSAESRVKFEDRFHAPGVQSYEALLKDPEVDGIVLATPHSTHASLATTAIRAGKHVFIEKPMTVTVESAQAVVEASEAGDVVVQVGHNRRKQTAARRIKQMIDNGDLGTVQSIEAVMSAPTAFGWAADGWRVNRDELPGGGLTVMGVHMIDTIHYLLGLPERVFAVSRRSLEITDVDEMTSSLLEFGGPIGYLSTSVTVPRVVTLAVMGSDASVWSEDDGKDLYLQGRGDKTRTSEQLTPNDPIQEEIAEFADCIRTGNAPEIGAREGYQAVNTMMAIVSSAENGEPVNLDWSFG